MLPRSLSSSLLALCLLIGPPATSHGQGENPPPLGPATTPAPVESTRETSPWYADAEFAVLFNTAVHLNEQVYSVKDYNSVFVSPRVFLGYTFDGGGSARFTYRNLTEVGNAGGQGGSGYGSWSDETFTVNWFDLDYVSREYALSRGWGLRWEAGGRFVYRYSGNSYDTPASVSEFRSSYFGGGPHVGLSSRCPLGDSGWSVFGRADTSITFGGVTEDYRTAWRSEWLTVMPTSHRTSFAAYQYDLNLQLGLVRDLQLDAYTARLGLGAQAEVLSFGDFRGGGSGTFGLVNVGPFLRGEVAY
jgi:hypothetical protein